MYTRRLSFLIICTPGKPHPATSVVGGVVCAELDELSEEEELLEDGKAIVELAAVNSTLDPPEVPEELPVEPRLLPETIEEPG